MGMKYIIVKEVEGKNIPDAVKNEKRAVIISIEKKDEEKEKIGY